jgi:hypothetical protein
MARKTQLEKWLESAMSTDTTRPRLLTLARTDAGNLATTDGYRSHVIRISNIYKTPTLCFSPGTWIMPEKDLAYKSVKCKTVKVDYKDVNRFIADQVNKKIIARVTESMKDLNDYADIFTAISSDNNHKKLLETASEFKRLLQQWMHPSMPIDISLLFPKEDRPEYGANFNAAYLIDAMSIIDEKRQVGQCELTINGSLSPLFIDFGHAYALIMPMRP